MIIGEALNQLHKTSPQTAMRIPLLRQAVDFRNLLIHGYSHVDPNRVWAYPQNHLPKLRSAVQTLLAEL